MSSQRLLAYFGHHKCASQWVISIIREVCGVTGLKWIDFHSARVFQHDLPKALTEMDIDFLCYSNADYQHVSTLRNFKGFHVIRDPRDVVVSAYFSHRYSHPTTEWTDFEIYRRKLTDLSIDEGLFLTMEERAHEFREMYAWDYSNPHILEVKLEELTINQHELFSTIFSFLGFLDDSTSEKERIQCSLLTAEALTRIVDRNQFSEKAKGRKPGEEDIHSHYRKGVAGDWANYFSDKHIRYFKEHHGDLLIKLGYERGSEWACE